jgi:PAS domain S-box-containing protein
MAKERVHGYDSGEPVHPATRWRQRPGRLGPLDGFVPQAVRRRGGEELRRARYTLALSVIGAMAFLGIAISEGLAGTRVLAQACGAAAALLLLVPPLLKATGSTPLASNGVLLIVFSLMSSLTIASGGAHVGVLYGACIVPLAAGLLVEKRVGAAWTLALVGVLVAVAVAVQRGVDFPLRPDSAVVVIAKFRGAIALTIAVLAVTLVYESIKSRAIRDLERAFEQIRAEEGRRAASEEALRESEKRYRTLFENALVCIHEIGPDGRILSMNPVGLQILGVNTEDDVSGMPYLDIVAPADRPRVASLLDEAYAGRVCEFEFDAILGSGRRRFASSFIPLSGEDGTVAKLIGHTHDVTERTRATAELKASEQKYQDLYENAPDMYVSVDAVTAQIVECNQTLADALRTTKQEIIGRQIFDLYQPDCRAGVDQVFDSFVKSGEAEGEDLRLRRDDGTSIDVSLKVSAVRDSDGRILYSRSAWRDVSERKRAEEALRESQERLAMALDATSEGVWDWNLVTGEVLFSRRWMESLGYEPGDFPNHVSAWEALVHPDDMPRVRTALEAHFEGRTRIYECENRLLMKSGEWRPNLDRGRVVRRDANGKPLRMVGVDIDIADRKQAEEALRQASTLESLGVLAGGIAHDFNNLLVGILGNADLAGMDLPPDSPGRESLAAIKEASRKASDLTNQLLVYAGRAEPRVESLDLGAVLAESVRLVRSSLDRGVAIQYQVPPDATRIDADATQIRQVLINLLINASEALGPQQGTIRVVTGVMNATREYLAGCYVGDELPEGDYAFVEVSDDGCGMDAQTLTKIFDPFFTTKSLGRGLGLASALGIVRGHRGGVRVDSDLGRGTTFRLLFPASTSEPTETAVRAPRVDAHGTVLVVDDEKTVLSVAERMLTRLGFDVVTVTTGRDALALLRERSDPFEAVMLDVTMPQMNGELTFEELRRLRPDLPVLFCSGHSARDGAALTASRASTAFLRKPFTVVDLADALAGLLDAPEPNHPVAAD